MKDQRDAEVRALEGRGIERARGWAREAQNLTSLAPEAREARGLL